MLIFFLFLIFFYSNHFSSNVLSLEHVKGYKDNKYYRVDFHLLDLVLSFLVCHISVQLLLNS